MNNSAHSMADVLGLPAEYRGLNQVGQHMFSNGSPLVTHVFQHLDEALQRFGKRVKIEEKFYRFSAGYRAGLASPVYAPRSGAQKQELMEYGLGYLKRKLDEMDKPKAVPAPVAKPVAPAPAPAPVAPPPPAPVAEDPALMDDFMDDDPPPAPEPVAPTKADLVQSIGVIAKRRGRPPKAR